MIFKNLTKAIGICLGMLLASQLTYGQSAVGIKNFRQILLSFSAVTGISAQDTAVATQYNAVLTKLPTNGEIGELGTPTVLAVAALGGVFCNRMIAVQSAITDVEARRYFRNLDFTQPPSQVPVMVRQATITEMVRGFWQREATSTEMNSLMTAFADGIVGQPDTPATLSSALQRTCGAIASSLDSIAF